MKGTAFLKMVSWFRVGIMMLLATLFIVAAAGLTPVGTQVAISEAGSPSPSFPDLAGHWAEETIRQMAGEGILSGYPDGSFRPDTFITRAEFCKAFALALSIAPSSIKSAFPDLESHWARDYILALFQLRMIQGYADGSFQPDSPITREEVATILQRALALLPLEHPPPFTDVPADSWAYSPVQAVVANGLMVGFPDGSFHPASPATRAEACIVSARARALPLPHPSVPTTTQSPVSPSPTVLPELPTRPVRLVFIHHSSGENWLTDGNGELGIALRDAGYFVSDTNYGWGPGGIGDRTDIGHWWEWFRGPESATILEFVLHEEEQNCSYARLGNNPDPGGKNQIVLFKSCYPNSALEGNPDDPVGAIGSNPLRGQDSSSPAHTVANAKGIYLDLLNCFAQHPDTLFLAITAPPLSDPTDAANARAFNQWLVQDWLKDYPLRNVDVFDFYNILTSNGGNPGVNDLGWETGNHHRWWENQVQHKTDGGGNTSAYPSAEGDDHPSPAGNRKATGELVPLLNLAYQRWRGSTP
jgi:hypothetical protein